MTIEAYQDRTIQLPRISDAIPQSYWDGYADGLSGVLAAMPRRTQRRFERRLRATGLFARLGISVGKR